MFLREIPSKGNIYYSLVHNVREKGRFVQRTIHYFGRLTDEEVKNIRRWIDAFPKGGEKFVPINNWQDVKKLASFLHGETAICHNFWRSSGFQDLFFEALGLDATKMAELIVVNRMVAPCSKLHILEWMQQTTLPFLLHLNANRVYNNMLYRAMDEIWINKDIIERNIWERKTKLSIDGKCQVYKDLTSSFFYGKKSEIGKYGYSRDKRPDMLQVNWGLVVTPDGKPITMEMYPGNVPDKNTVAGTCHKLKTLFKIKECIFLGDRGTITEDNVRIVKDHEYQYIFAEVEDNVKEIIEEGLSKKFDVIDEDMSACQIEKVDEKYIIIKSKDKLIQDMETRERRVSEGEEILNAGLRTVKNGTWVKHDVVLKHLLKKLVKKNVDTYFELHIPPTPVKEFTWTRKRIEQEKIDGIWVLRTDLNQSMGEIIEMYRGMWIIEKGFRTIKSVIEVRPINHRRKNRIGAHLFLCVMAYYLEKEMEVKGKEHKLEMEAYQMIEKMKTITFDRIRIGGIYGIDSEVITNLNSEQSNILEVLEINKKNFNSVEVSNIFMSKNVV